MKKLFLISAKPSYSYLVVCKDFWEAWRIANKNTPEINSITEFTDYGVISGNCKPDLKTLERRFPIDVVQEIATAHRQQAPAEEIVEVKIPEARKLFIWTVKAGDYMLLNEDGYVLSTTQKNDYLKAREYFQGNIEKWSHYLKPWYAFVEAQGTDMVTLKGLHDKNFKSKSQMTKYEKNILKIK